MQEARMTFAVKVDKARKTKLQELIQFRKDHTYFLKRTPHTESHLYSMLYYPQNIYNIFWLFRQMSMTYTQNTFPYLAQASNVVTIQNKMRLKMLYTPYKR